MCNWPLDHRVRLGAWMAALALCAFALPAWAQTGAAPANTAQPAIKKVASTRAAVAPVSAPAPAQDLARLKGIGRSATPAEIAAWDIDVRADFVGLPKGAGSVAKGMEVWEAKCASCHGVFGESNEIFQPIVGGTTKADMQSGRVANLQRADYPGRTTMMKLSHLSTMWDYIYRAMPWNAPKSLSVEEVYAVTGYILHLADVVPANFVLSHENIAQVQQTLPNRNGKTTEHTKWPGTELLSHPLAAAFDVQGSACMVNCGAAPRIESQLPPHARNAHGNLAEQQRLVGAQRGVDTTQAPVAVFGTAGPLVASAARSSPAPSVPASPAASPSAAPSAVASAAGTVDAARAQRLAQQHTCTACHGADRALVGPSFADIARKHAGKVDYLADKIKNGGVGVWGAIPMPAQALPVADARLLGQWLAAGAPRR